MSFSHFTKRNTPHFYFVYLLTLNRNIVHPVLFPLPKEEEQKEIADILKSGDTKIQALEKEISLTDELFQAALEKLMTGKLSTQPLIEV
ncbi:restriction endonuclease subunit S domain-containing protein [Dolichospermum compactum]|uniref:Type I restriction modification DNA specificity domain-containing protein n=1 Tax=Dolichospermum compactum NIES-806 TaxID=1973481 RepID=A0A1Z4UYB0_9CYAN|nr:restriction endonuclease subunit S [Dolichospermum compactum]BAZ84164.1 hypothetical protein NIES806_03470 [Dolichospermum compactum NIES-806]